MSTAQDRITRAMQLLAVSASGETLPADITADCLTALTLMLEEWEGADFGFTAPTLATASAAIGLPEADWECVAVNLAVRMAPEFEVEPPAFLIAASGALLSQLRSRYFKPAY